jgi:hypothetical protein
VLILGYVTWHLRRRRRRRASAAASRTDEAHESENASETAGVTPDCSEAAETSPGDQEAEKIAPDRSEDAGAGPGDQGAEGAEGIAPTEYATGHRVADRHAPEKP